MDLTRYLIPDETVAQTVIFIQSGLFALWTFSLLIFIFRERMVRSQISRVDVARLYLGEHSDSEIFQSLDTKSARRVDSAFPRNTALKEHLKALGEARQAGRQADVGGLLRMTTDRLLIGNSWLRSVLSLFIILGLLGTLLGLAASLSHLSTLSPGGQQITNESLSQGLNILLGKLGGAFAPSIWGVTFTVAGVLLFSIYTRLAAAPLKLALEEATLRTWAPALAGQKVDEAALMKENIKAAQQIASAAESIGSNVDKLVLTFNSSLPALVESLASSVNNITEKLSSEATELASDVQRASKTLKALTVATENLNNFSDSFKTSVESLYPFSDASQLRELYEALLERSTTIIENNETFQESVSRQLDHLATREGQLTEAVTLFEQKVSEVSAEISAEVGGTSAAAKQAFERLSAQNETVIRELVTQVGEPVAARLEPIPATLASLNHEVRQINAPLQGVRDSIAETSYQVIKHAEERLAHLDEKLMAQVTNIDILSKSIDSLGPTIDQLTERVGSFNSKADGMTRDVNRFGDLSGQLTDKFGDLGRKVDRASELVGQRNYNAPRPSNGQKQTKDGPFKRLKIKLFG